MKGVVNIGVEMNPSQWAKVVRCSLEQCRDGVNCDCAEVERRKVVVKIGVEIDPFRYTSAGSGGVEKETACKRSAVKEQPKRGLI
jgi:hypothetical protein